VIQLRLGARLIGKSGTAVVQSGEQNAETGIISFFLMGVSREKIAIMDAGSTVFCQTLIWIS
jgi:hypothetical protein